MRACRFRKPAHSLIIRSEAACFKKTVITATIEDDVIQERNTHNRPRSLELTGYFNIGRGRFKAAAGVIMRHDNRRGSIQKDIRKYLSRVDRRFINQAYGYNPDIQDFVRPIDAGANKVLLLPVSIV